MESLGTLLGPRGAPGWFWRGPKKRSKKEVLRNHAGVVRKGGGVPIGIDLEIDSWDRSRDRSRDRLEPQTSRL